MRQDLAAEIGRQIVPVERYFAGKFDRFAEDARQQAWLVCLENAHRYDPTIPGAHIFFERVAFLEVAQQVNRWISALSLSRQASRTGVGRKFVHGADLDADGMAGPFSTPEAEAMRADLDSELTRLRVRWQRVVSVATRRLPARVRAAGDSVYGMEGSPMAVYDAAVSSGRWRDDVEADARRFTRALKKHPEARSLAGLILEAQGEV